ncbi:MAG TPA: signal peptide peptidase SppA [Alphaproteobacteria bacterium]|nr:signal peptide peptidase SppA [Alphaproteobacteria bacterium]HOO51832.1 signal peptide peptidase SppA [Alphaproteobacteria bacterium]
MSHHHWLKGRTVVYNPVPKTSSVPMRKRFSIGRILWTALKRTCMVIGAVFLFSALIGVLSALQSGKESVPQIPKQVILGLHLEGAVPEESGTSEYMELLGLGDRGLTFYAMLDALEQGANDPRVKALVFRVSDAGYNITQLQELREAVMHFRTLGKKAYIYSESYGGSGYGLGLYYLASAFDEIWMQPVGVVAVGGINSEKPFFKDVMEKYGVEAQFFQRKEYKNAMEHLTSSKMSAASREETQGVIDTLSGQLVGPIKADRSKVSKSFDALLDLGMHTDRAALESGLIDRMDYEDVLDAHLKEVYLSSKIMSLDNYSKALAHEKFDADLLGGKKTSVAVVHVDGMIVSGSSGGRSPYGLEEQLVGADDIADAIIRAARDKKIKAIVVRVNSPGGVPSASETIARAIAWAQESKKKPVYVSMGSMAASGGYWISAGATKIYAMDATLTGSIGVVGGKINLQGLWNKYDVHWESVSYGKNSGMMSMNTPFSASEQKQFELTLDNVYDHFIDRVATGRKMTKEQAEAVAKGHVWTGQEAKEKGLVDEIGGLNDVLDQIALDHGLASRAQLRVIHSPSEDDPFEMLFSLLGVSSDLSLPQKVGAALSTVRVIHSSPRLVLDPSLPDLRG